MIVGSINYDIDAVVPTQRNALTPIPPKFSYPLLLQ